jgi:hypothetical protein
MVPGRILLQSLTDPYRALDSTEARAPNSKFYYVICLFLRFSRPFGLDDEAGPASVTRRTRARAHMTDLA